MSVWFTTLVVLTGAVPVADLPAKPDIVVLLADDLGQLDVTPYGGRGMRTPQVQQLADSGLTFERAYVASPSCAPSRAALLTGLMPARNGAEANHSRPRAELKKWPAYFQELGYEVVAFGKVSHYKHTVDYGFDHFAHDTFHDHAAIPAAVEYLQHRPRENAKPLCLMVGSNWPHVPWPEVPIVDANPLALPPQSVSTPLTHAWRERYRAAVRKSDDDVGAVLEAVRQHLRPNPLILYSSDHGAQWPFGKWNCYEAGVAVPLIVSWPGVIPPNTRTQAMVSWIDFLPTLIAAAGGQPPDFLDGRSFLPVLQNPAAAHRDRIYATHSGDGNMNIYPIRSVRHGDWKYIRNVHPEFRFTTHIDLAKPVDGNAYWQDWVQQAAINPVAAAIVEKYHHRPAEELYDLSRDPHEQQNLAAGAEHAGRLAALRSDLDAWLAAQGDKLTVFNEPRR
jgi:N-sulfoglucosamine sulfohydrolase